jgi:DNA-binding SARP family transcriptional activator
LPTLRVRLLGPFEISTDQQALPVPSMRKAQELLALLLLAPQRRVLRDVAADQLWPSAGPESSRKAIRQALWQVHLATDVEPAESSRLLMTSGDAISVNPARPVWLDVASFVCASGAVQRTEANDLGDDDLDELAATAELYRGPLLDGCYEDWCVVERTHLEDLHISLLDKLSTAHEHLGRLTQAIAWAVRLLEVEPAHERSHRRLMQLYYRNDDRTRALRQWRRCQRVLEDELGIRPSKRTARLAATIGADAEDEPAPTPGPSPPAVSDNLSDLRDEVAALRRSIDAISDRLWQARV